MSLRGWLASSLMGGSSSSTIYWQMCPRRGPRSSPSTNLLGPRQIGQEIEGDQTYTCISTASHGEMYAAPCSYTLDMALRFVVLAKLCIIFAITKEHVRGALFLPKSKWRNTGGRPSRSQGGRSPRPWLWTRQQEMTPSRHSDVSEWVVRPLRGVAPRALHPGRRNGLGQDGGVGFLVPRHTCATRNVK